MFLKGHWPKNVAKKVINRKVLPKGQWPKILLRGCVIYRKKLCGKACCRSFLLKKKTIIGVSVNKNNSVEKIIGWLVVQKQVCDQKLLQRTVCDRKASDTENVNDRNCVKTNSFYRKKKQLFLVVHSQKIIDEKGCLEYLWRKSRSPKTSRIKRWRMEICFATVSLCETFLIQKNFSEQNLWSLKTQKVKMI